MADRTDSVRALTVRQPWAWAIALGGKNIENRSMGTRYRGPLAIHAGLTMSEHGLADPRVREALARVNCRPFTAEMISPTMVGGCVVAIAELADCHVDQGCCRPWGESEYVNADGHRRRLVWHWVLEEVRAFDDPPPARGALGLWRPDADLAQALGR